MCLDSKNIWIFFLVVICSNDLTAQIILSEVVTKNESSLVLADKTPDWIELYNPSENIINLEGYYLSDDLEQPSKWRFPNFEVSPKQFLVIYADGKDMQDDFLHTNFKLSADGESLILSSPNLTEIEQVRIPSLETDISYAKVNGDWIQTLPTPNKENQQIVLQQLSPPVFSETSQLSSTPIELKITNDQQQGSEFEYWVNDLANKREVDSKVLELTIDSSIIICARVVKKGYLPSETICQSFLINQGHELPVLSIIADEDALFDETKGMFQPGPDASKDWPFLGANFWSDKDTEAYFQYFNSPNDTVFYGHGDLEMHGGRESRTNPQKTFRLLAKAKYEQPFFEHAFFPIKSETKQYKRLVIRNASGDFNAGHCRDGFLQNYLVSSGLDLDANSYQPIAVYINGAYYGMMGLREKMDKYYTQSNYQTTAVDLLENNGALITGDTQTFQQQYDYLLKEDLSDPLKFKQATDYFDHYNLTDYFIAQIGNVSTAWPQNNIKYWRAKAAAGKWRFLLYDMDIALARHKWTLASENALLNKMTSFDNQNFFINIVNAFLANNEFRNYFFNRHQDLFNTVLSSKEMLSGFDKFVEQVDFEMGLQFARWPTNTYEKWQTKEQGKIRDFMEDRAAFSMQHYNDYFELGGIYQLTLAAHGTDLVQFDLNSLEELPTGFKGQYFKQIPITVFAQNLDTKQFAYWEVKQDNQTLRKYANPLIINFNTDTELTPFFTEKPFLFSATILKNEGNEIEVNIRSNNTNLIRYQVVDLLGRVLNEKELSSVKIGNNVVKIPINNLQHGFLFLNVQQDEKNHTTKFFHKG